MKKLLLAVVAVFTVVSLTACRRNLDAFEILERSHEAQIGANVVSMTSEIEMEMTMDMGFMTLNFPMTMALQMENENRMRVAMEMTMPGMDVFSSVVYFRDGFQYTEEYEFGEFIRNRDSVEMVQNDEILQLFEINEMMEIASEMVERASAESLDNGGYRLEFVYNLDGVLAFIEDGFDFPGMEEFTEMMDVVDLGADDFSMTTIMYLDENYLPTTFVSDMMMTLVVEEDGITIEMVLEMTITVILGDVRINFPAWMDDLDPAVEPIDLVGIWEWDLGGFIYVFNADGTGQRGFASIQLIDFEWEIVDDYHLYIDLGLQLERWILTLEDDRIHITDLDEASVAVFTYIRNDDFVFETVAETPDDNDEIEE